MSLPPDLDFDRDRSGTPERMNRAMEYLYRLLQTAVAQRPEFETAIAQLRGVGLDRLNEVLAPVFLEATAIEAQLVAIRAAWLTGAPLTQLMTDLAAQVTARLATVDASVAAQLAGVAAQLAANTTAIDNKLATVDAKLGALSPTAKWAEASAADARAATASRLISAASLWAMYAAVALVDGATVPVDLAAGVNFSLVLAGNRVLAAPTGTKPGQRGIIRVSMDAAGRTLSYAAAYKFLDGSTAPSLNDGGLTLLEYVVSATGEVFLFGGKPPVAAGSAHPGYASGRTYTLIAGTPSSNTISGGLTTAVPFPIPTPTTISGVKIAITTSAAQGVRVGIYTTVNGSPGVLIAEASGNSSTTAEVIIALSLTLPPGTYWCAVRFNSSVSMQSVSGAGVSTVPLVGSPNGTGFNNPGLGLVTTGGSGAALQTPFVATGTASLVGLVGIVVP